MYIYSPLQSDSKDGVGVAEKAQVQKHYHFLHSMIFRK